MPDYLKEEVQALREAVNRLINADQAQKGFQPLPPGRVLGTRVSIAGGASHLTQSFFTPGWDGTQTTVPMLLDFSPLDGTDGLTM